ncbi:hypothetical protein NGRA_2325 [Nosema granulosis]|uniref:Uncharacterized protein n=1 Tax=Nosema granulosis TaxID=83296 RepID=A0A9P6H034_9MICR|nr:hypothetical protein NGRA_2325 [Nosema granulosis]
MDGQINLPCISLNCCYIIHMSFEKKFSKRTSVSHFDYLEITIPYSGVQKKTPIKNVHNLSFYRSDLNIKYIKYNNKRCPEIIGGICGAKNNFLAPQMLLIKSQKGGDQIIDNDMCIYRPRERLVNL